MSMGCGRSGLRWCITSMGCSRRGRRRGAQDKYEI